MKILVFDNYDSFTYNLVYLVEKFSEGNVDVFRNDRISLEEIGKYDKILLSPGPGLPKDAGIMPELIREFAAKKSILGVCLGHQAIGEAFGGKLINLEQVYHGVATEIQTTDPLNGKPDQDEGKVSSLFDGLPGKFEAGRYHSWVVSRDGFPEELQITAVDQNGYVMALQHRSFDVQGVQFHPESVLTPAGATIIANWLKA